MTTAYTTLLGLALPVEGELTGTWGATVNNSITNLVEDAIANYATHDVTSGDWTLSTTGSGASNEARMAMLIPTGSPSVARNIIAPGHSKMYLISNQSSKAVTIKSASSSGVSVPAGLNTIVAWDTNDFVEFKPQTTLKATNVAGGTAGAVPYQSAADTTAFLSIGPAGYFLKSSGAVPEWVAGSAVEVNTGTSTDMVGFVKGSGTNLGATVNLIEPKTTASISSGNVALNCATANLFAVVLNANITSFTMSNIPASGSMYGFILAFACDGTARSVTWTFSGTAVKWADGTAPTLTSTNGKVDNFGFYTVDGGTNWFGFILGQNQ